MYSHDKQNYAILPESVKFRDEFRSFRNNFVNECGDGSCAGGSCDNSGKTGFDWCMEYGELDGQDMSWLDFVVEYTGDSYRFNTQEEVEEFLTSISYDDMVAKFGTPEDVVAKEGGLTTADYVDPETNLENESCCCGGGKKKNNKKSKWMPFWAKKNKKGKGSKVEEALELLKKFGYETILNEATNEITVVVNTFIKHTSTKSADHRTSEGRRTYYMNAGAFGLEDYRPKKGEDAPKETAETRKAMLQRAMKQRLKNNAAGSDAEQMGSSTVGMIHKKADFISTKSWTWVDFEAMQEHLANFGLKASEQHTQVTVSQDVDEEPVADWGHDGPYGENSSYITYFSTYAERTWVFKIVGTPEQWIDFYHKEFDIDLVENEFDFTYTEENDEIFKNFVTKFIPAFNKYGDSYEINISLKQA